MHVPNKNGSGHSVRLIAAALALFGAALAGAACHHPVVSDAEINTYCQKYTTAPATCAQTYSSLRDEAEAVGCGAEFAVFFRCRSHAKGDAPCSDDLTPVEECGLRHDPQNVCVLANQHATTCGVTPPFGPEPGLCDGNTVTWCSARCFLGADCETLRQLGSEWASVRPGIHKCVEECVLLSEGVIPGAIFWPE